MNKLGTSARATILQLLCEGSSIRASSRVSGASKNTVAKLLSDAGKACAEYQQEALRNLLCKRIQIDAIWSFVCAKKENAPTVKGAPEVSVDVWTWTAVDANTKLVLSWLVGARDAEYAHAFMNDISSRVTRSTRLTSDGQGVYLEATEAGFDLRIDYTQLVKMYGAAPDAIRDNHSPGERTGIKIKDRSTRRDVERILSTSWVERQDDTMRMHTRRFALLASGLSKKVENHAHAVALHFMFYNFVKIHSTLQVTPAMEAGVTKRVWDVSDIVKLVDEREAVSAARRRGTSRRTAVSN